jgi:hypothetical protein
MALPARKPGRRHRGSRKAAAMEAVFTAKLEGRTFVDVARELGFSPQYAGRLYREALDERAAVIGELADRERAVQDERLEALIREHWPNRANPKAAEVILRCLDRKARLFALDAPTRLEHSGGVGVSVETSEARRARIWDETWDEFSRMSPEQLAVEVEHLTSSDRYDVESGAVEVSE